MHINEDYFYCEVVDLKPVNPCRKAGEGRAGRHAAQKQALPLLRPHARHHPPGSKNRANGRTTIRMQKIAGRSDDMLIIRGVNVFPSQIESALIGMEGIGPHYEIVVTKKGFIWIRSRSRWADRRKSCWKPTRRTGSAHQEDSR